MDKISLGKLEKSRLSEKNMKELHGGDRTEYYWTNGVRCGCRYANSGGSSTNANNDANVKAGLWTEPRELKIRIICENDATYVAR